MADGLVPMLRYLHRIAAGACSGELSDAQLLERFVRQQDEAAFSVLLQRHAGMVWNVCSRVLRDRHQAEDAFQAVFLVFVRKAGAIAQGERLANWLYGVAVRVAKKAKVQACKRRVREREVPGMVNPGPTDASDWNELSGVLDEEMRRLPAKYRGPLVLCCLEGMSNAQAARQLGCPEGTLRSWLTRARGKLRQRLQRRGTAVPAAALASLLAQNAASAALPAGLVDATLSLSHAVLTTGQLGCASATVAALTEGVLKDMVFIKLKIAAALVAAAVVLAGSGWAVQQSLADKPAQRAAAEVAAAAPEQAPRDLTPAQFDQLLKLIKPQAGELRFREIPWLLNVTEARKQAAAEGKPILVWSGNGGAPIGIC